AGGAPIENDRLGVLTAVLEHVRGNDAARSMHWTILASDRTAKLTVSSLEQGGPKRPWSASGKDAMENGHRQGSAVRRRAVLMPDGTRADRSRISDLASTEHTSQNDCRHR